ncbi:hypothetical protein [Streptomyces sp. B29(2018)]|uniref:hypothetical protein n=1 Tax=Streptomyces sp. B29(2018) TaxID=2485016 RepID=UPI000FD675B0|nr:hypothetical protein [Streptomyces sp. B29(2018)]
MGGDSKSSSKQESTNVDQTFNFVEGTGDGDRLNLALSEGARVGDVNFTQTDYGALEKAYELNKDSNDLALTATEMAFDAANNFAGKSFQALDAGYDYAKDLNADSLDFASSTLSEVLSAAADQQQATRDQADRDTEKAFALATTHGRSEGGEAMQSALKIGAIGVGLFGSAFVLREVINRDKK